jgi:hypothetical protein
VALVGLAVPAFVVLGHVLDLADHVKEMAQSEMPLDTDPTTLVSAFPVLTASLVIFGIMTVLYAVLLCSARVQDVRRSRHHSRSVEAD